MLEHQHQTPVSGQAASQQRITPEEMSVALAALESRREEEAQRMAGTVPIGQAVQELGLDVTPEQVWEQVQAQRAAAAPKAVSAPSVVTPLSAAQETPVTQGAARHRRRRWRWIVLPVAVFAVCSSVFSSTHGIIVNGDRETLNYSGNRGSVTVTGDEDHLTLAGNCDTLFLTGDRGTVAITGYVHQVIVVGDHDTVTWAQENPADPPRVSDEGDGNMIGHH